MRMSIEIQREYEDAARNQLYAHENCTKADLMAIMDREGIDYRKSWSWDKIYDAAVEGLGFDSLVERFCGVSSQKYQERFGITHQDVKRLERFGVLRVTGDYEFRAFGKTHWAPLYSMRQFYEMSDEDMQQLLREFPKGKRLKK